MTSTPTPLAAIENAQSISKAGFLWLASLTGVLGLAASAATAKFFVLGLDRLEADKEAQQVLVAAGILMVLTELVAFGVAALLPRKKLKGLRVQLIAFGLVLLAFEGVTIYTTQAAMMHTAAAAGTGAATRITELRTTIDAQRQAARDLRHTGAAQGASSNSWSRQLGAGTLKLALEAEQALLPLARELAALEANTKPTMHDILGQQGMLAYAVARSLLISAMGLVMFGAAGALLRAARETVAYTDPSAIGTVVSPMAERFSERQKVQLLQISAHNNFNRIKMSVIDGTIKPSVRSIRGLYGGSTASIQAALYKLCADGTTERSGQGWAIAACSGGAFD